MKLDKAALEGLLAAVHAAVVAERDTLTLLDQELGDGDLGLSMGNGLGAALEYVRGADASDSASELLTQAGFEMAEKAPSTMGTLVSIGIVRAGKAIKGKEELDAETALGMLKAAAEGIAARGKAKRGEKTILDALYPAIEASEKAIAAGADLAAAGAAAAAGAEAGVEETKKLKSTYGKAAVFGESSIGKRDPGATAAAIILAGAAKWCAEAGSPR